MSTFDEDPVLGPEELLDSSRLAAAWQVAHERAAEEAVPASATVTTATDVTATTPTTIPAPATPAIPPALPVADAYRRFLDELKRLRATSPELAAPVKQVLVGPLKQLAAALERQDGAAAEKVLDELEDLLQSLLATAGWPTMGEE